MTRNIQRDIALRLLSRRDTRSVAQLLKDCTAGDCDECGDVCPIKGNRRTAEIVPAVERAFVVSKHSQIWKVAITRSQWARAHGDLAHVSLGAIEKTLRRSLDDLREPTIAVGTADAWYGWQQWEVGAELLIAGSTKSQLLDALPAAKLQIDEILNVKTAARKLLGSARTAKRTSAFLPSDQRLRKVRRGEYYAWLASLAPGSRIFRYGCDRYFNLLTKSPRPIRHIARNGHPYPTWLRPYQFGSHDMKCSCRICQRQRY